MDPSLALQLRCASGYPTLDLGGTTPLEGTHMRRSMIVASFVCSIFLLLVSLPVGGGELVGTEAERERMYPNVVKPTDVVGSYGLGAGQFLDTQGVALDDSGRLYVVECANPRIQIIGLDDEVTNVWGSYGNGPGQFRCLRGVAVDGHGRVYVSDSSRQKVIVLADGKTVREWGEYGSAPGQFNQPAGLAVDDERVYVADFSNHRISVFSLTGDHLFSIGSYGTGDTEFAGPKDVAVDAKGNIYVADSMNARVSKFAPSGDLITHIGSYGTYPGELSSPTSIAIQGELLYVADLVNHRAQVFDLTGNFRYQWGRHPVSIREKNGGRMHYPTQIAVSPSGLRAAVCEPFEARCQVFDNKIVLSAYQAVSESAWWEKYPYFHYRCHAELIPEEDVSDVDHDLLAMAEEDIHRIVVMKIVDGKPMTALQFGSYGSEPGQFKHPQGVFANKRGELFVVDTLNHRIQVFDFQGKLLRTFGHYGSGPGEFREPGAGSTDSEGLLYIPDAGNHRIQVLDANGNFVRSWGTFGTGDGEFNLPIHARVDNNRGRVYVVDLHNHRIQVFDLAGNFLFKFGGRGTERGKFISPQVIGLDPVDGTLLISDESLNRIQRFDGDDGSFISMFGRYGTAPGEFYTPVGVAIDRYQTAYVVDYGNHRGQMFDKNATPLGIFGERVIEFRDQREAMDRRLEKLIAANAQLEEQLARTETAGIFSCGER